MIAFDQIDFKSELSESQLVDLEHNDKKCTIVYMTDSIAYVMSSQIIWELHYIEHTLNWIVVAKFVRQK